MKPNYLNGKQALLLDMNGTFMFGEDRFGEGVDYSLSYKKLGGELSDQQVNQLIQRCYRYLDERYRVLKYRTTFPTLADAISQVSDEGLSSTEIAKVIQTFAMHERGHIPPAYVVALQRLNQQFQLSLVIDIWTPKTVWINYFQELGIHKFFEVMSFSSDHGHVKPSAYGFL
jgi:FMN phosphatase YigB (HAD superfamily)